jgi:hypothetical protein
MRTGRTRIFTKRRLAFEIDSALILWVLVAVAWFALDEQLDNTGKYPRAEHVALLMPPEGA